MTNRTDEEIHDDYIPFPRDERDGNVKQIKPTADNIKAAIAAAESGD
jgi:hypothetical protein